jgi:hypothetical protein
VRQNSKVNSEEGTPKIIKPFNNQIAHEEPGFDLKHHKKTEILRLLVLVRLC